jgi:hypothetical protein
LVAPAACAAHHSGTLAKGSRLEVAQDFDSEDAAWSWADRNIDDQMFDDPNHFFSATCVSVSQMKHRGYLDYLPNLDESHAQSKRRDASNWLTKIDDDLLDRCGSRKTSLPSGTDWVPAPQSASDFAASRSLPPARRSEAMFVSVAQYNVKDFQP